MSWQIPLADLTYGSEEEAAVLDILRNRWLTMGEETELFEDEFAAFTGAGHALAVANGTSALHLAAMALDLGEGDEVILPALTFVATANAIRYTGATPIFAEVANENDLNLDPEDVASKITGCTRAIFAVHYGGYPCDMKRLMTLARSHGLAVVEDAAHAPGAWLEERHLGTWGDIGCFSFFSNKNLATGEGGMVTTDDDALADRLRLLRSHGMTTLSWDRHKGHTFSYDVIVPGYNYRIDELRSALGRVQLEKLPAGNERRRQLSDLYSAYLAELTPQLAVPFQNHPGISSCHIRPVLLPQDANRRRFMAAMKKQGIQTSIHYPPIHQFTYYRQQQDNAAPNLPLTESIAAREVTLPLYAGMSPADVERVVYAARSALITSLK